MIKKIPILKRNGRMIKTVGILAAVMVLCLSGNWLSLMAQSGAAPFVNAQSAVYDESSGRVIIKGQNFNRQASVALSTPAGPLAGARIKIKGSKKIYVSNINRSDIEDGLDVMVTNPDGSSSGLIHVSVALAVDPGKLTADDVRTVIAQAVAQAEASGLKVTIAVTDKEGNVLGVFKMRGAPKSILIGIGTRCAGTNSLSKGLTCGLEGLNLGPDIDPDVDGAVLGAISKAGTAGVLSTAGGAFTPRIANFLLQEHIPPGIKGAPSGPLFGVQFSQLLCGDVDPSLPLGLAADPGGIPLYKNGQPVGGVGVEGDGKYGLANRREERQDKPAEELIALAAGKGFEPSPQIIDTLFPGGLRLPYANQQVPASLQAKSFNSLDGSVDPTFPIIDTPASRYQTITLGGIQVRTKIDIPIRAGSNPGGLTKAEVERILIQSIKQALITRAVIHQPVGSHIEVSVGVVDESGEVLGAVSTLDAPVSSYDISVQKARSAAFTSSPIAGAILRSASGGQFLPNRPFAKYAAASAREGLNLDGSVAISGRALIFLSRPFLPDGIDETENGPFSNPIEDNSAFNTGLQLDLVISRLLETAIGYVKGAEKGMIPKAGVRTCTPDADGRGFKLANGIQVRQASVPLYKNGRLVGGIGCSGDGDQQEDIVVGFGSAGFEAEPSIRSDRVFVRDEIRLPWLKYPRHPNLD
jgi:uncharacterized protein GlcG (DUF336 family)